MMNQVINGVQFQNLPAFLSEQGKISYPLRSWAVAELVASKIPDDVRMSVIVDFSKVDVGKFLPELNNGETFDSAEDPEQKILSYIFGSENHED